MSGRKILNGFVRDFIRTWIKLFFLTRKVFDYCCSLFRSIGINLPANPFYEKLVNGTIDLADGIKIEYVRNGVQLAFVLICNHFYLLFTKILNSSVSTKNWNRGSVARLWIFFNSDCNHYFRKEKHNFLNR